ncbi:MAG TPA: ligase [Burkholderiales bacterium]|nr:ligase [Burkholderiales bacterium]
MIPGARVHFASAVAEQAWIAGLVSETVRHPRIGFWVYSRPAVVLGASQRLDEGLRRRAAVRGMQVCRRIGGGGAVLAGPWMLGVSVILPPHHPLAVQGIVAAYRWFGEAHARALAAQGIRCRSLPPARIPAADPSWRWACFGQLSPWEVVAGTRKLVGLCQARKATATVLSSGILIQMPPWGRLSEVMCESPGHGRLLGRRTTACGHLLGRHVDPVRLATDLHRRLRTNLDAALTRP